MQHRKGRSYIKRVLEIQAIYDEWSRIGLSNREIWRRHIYPKYCICERTFNNIINREVEEDKLPSFGFAASRTRITVMATNKDFSEIIRHILQDVRVELDDAFDRNFERQAFFSENGRALSIPLRQDDTC